MRGLVLTMALLLTSPGCEKPPAERAAPRAAVDAGASAVAVGRFARAVADAGPDREPVDLEPGRWKLGDQDLCVEVFPDHTIELAVAVTAGKSFTLTLRLIDGGAQLEVCSAKAQCAVLDRAARTSRTTALEKT